MPSVKSTLSDGGSGKGAMDGLRRPRLIKALDLADRTGLGLVVAPLGSGKTTLLEQWAQTRPGTVRWLTEGGLGLDDAKPLTAGVRTVLVDDAHRFSPIGMAALAGLIEASAPRTTFVVASRTLPGFNLARREFPTPALLTEDDLRFSASEVVKLFRVAYRTEISQEGSAELARATGGWAAALHLHHLAERAHPLSAGSRGKRVPGRVLLVNHSFTRDYLTREALDPLPPALVHFLRMTSVLDPVTVRCCDLLLNWDGSGRALRELSVRSGLVRADPNDSDSYHYHPVLRAHLRGQLGDLLGTARTRALVERAHDIASGVLPSPAAVPTRSHRVPRTFGAQGNGLEVRCLGDFRMRVDGRDVDLSSVRPVARTVLRALAVHAGAPYHREQLVEVFWPEGSLEAGIHSLHVAVSSLRRCIETTAPGRSHELLARCGAAYALAPGAGVATDIQWVEACLLAAAQADRRGDGARRRKELRVALEAYAGDILPEDGPAEWVVAARERLRLRVATCAAELARLELARGNPARAVQAATRSVEIDPFRDEAWRLLIASHLRAGDRAQAALARMTYRSRLHELGLDAGRPDRAHGAAALRTS